MDFSMDHFRLDGKIALVTGAVYGIGFTIAQSLAAAGATIVFNNLTQESVDEGIKIIKQPASKPMAMSVMSPMKQQSMKWSKP